MDFDKITAFLVKQGPWAVIAGWGLWNIQTYAEKFLVSNTQIVELLRQLVELHRHP